MSQYPQASFIKSANAPDQFVPDEGAEVAFAGRSNAGKSSAINVIVNRRQFARTSKTPGRTRLVNFFTLREEARLVFEIRASLKGMFLIVDIRRQLTDFDKEMLAFAELVGLPVHVLLTKSDKLKRGQAANALLKVRRELGDVATVQQFSALNRQGEDEARARLEAFLTHESE